MYRRSADIEDAVSALAAWFPDLVTKIDLDPSVEGRPISALRIRGGDLEERHGVLLVGGIHARELLNPDLLVELAMGLVEHYVTETDWVLGDRVWGSDVVKVIVEVLDTFILPNANPDGREHVFDVYSLWRKNRAPLAGTSCVGVDLNRNFDLLWGIKTRHGGVLKTSLSPCSDVFVGPGAFSEPETANVKRLLDDHAVRCYVDVHSFSELVLHPWGHAPNQTLDPSQRYTLVDTSGWEELPTDAPDYEEYMPPADLERFTEVGEAAADAIHDVRGRTYTVQQGVLLYPTTGTSSDYAYSRHVADPAVRKVYGFTLETGPWTGDAVTSFQPAPPELDHIKEEATSGLLSVLASCVCAVDFVGSSIFGAQSKTVERLREARDRRLAATKAGRAWVAMLDRHQLELTRLALVDEDLRREAGELLDQIARLLGRRGELTRELAARAMRFLDRIGEATPSEELRRDLEVVRRTTRRLVGSRVSEVFERLTSSPPRRRTPRRAE